MAEPLSRPGGIVNFSTGEKALVTDIERVGRMAEQGLYGVLARLLKDEVAGDERSGFCGAGDCLVSVSAGLTMSVAAGFGLYDDEAATDAFGPILKPIVVPTAFTSTLDAHEANPRIDIICLAPADTDDESETRSVLADVNDLGSAAAQSVNKRTRRYYATQTVKGTAAATPSAPSTPSGYLKVAECRVPATSGAVTVTDTRTILQLGEAFARYTPPPRDYHQAFVPGSSSECEVSGSISALSVSVAAGAVHINESRRQISAQTVSLDTAHATNPRYDIVVAYEDGTVGKVTGTAAGSPSPPSTPSNAVILAVVSVPATATVTAPNRVTDCRPRRPVSKDQLGIAYPVGTAATESSDAITVAIQVKDSSSGGALLRSVRLLVEVLTAYGVVTTSSDYRITIGSGTGVTPTNSPAIGNVAARVLDTTALGAASVTVTDVVTGASRGCFLRLTPLNEPGVPVLVDLPFN